MSSQPPVLSRARQWTGFALAVVGLPLITLTLLQFRDNLHLPTDVLVMLAGVIAVTLVGGRWPALLAAIGGFALLNFFFTEPYHTFVIADLDEVVALVVFLVVAIALSVVVDVAERRAWDAAQAASHAQVLTEADKMRTALLAAVSHDLRTPLASAMAAVTSLSNTDVAFSAADRAELLDTASKSLDRLHRLVVNLLDMSRLQAGVLGVTAVPTGLDDVVPHALDELGEQRLQVRVDIAPDTPEVTADPGLLERILVNLVGNALRFSPADRPPAITVREHGGRVELYVIDHGPGIPESDRDRVFQPFQRLGDTDNSSGVGLGLALSAGLAEAMGATLTPVTTPGGGLTMVLALPVADVASNAGAVPA